MRTIHAVRIVAAFLTAVMFAAIGMSIATGDLASEGSDLLALPWGRMSLIDLYAGVILLFGWVVLRERTIWVALAWLPVFVLLGNAGTALYATIAAFRADDVSVFLAGAQSGGASIGDVSDQTSPSALDTLRTRRPGTS